MTLILIHNESAVRREALIEWLNGLLGMNYMQLSQIIGNPDIHMINNPPHVSIKIEEVKQLQREMVYRPFQSSVQVGVIFHSDMLTIEAQNALLKTLEEPGEQTHYILLVENERNLLPTILSRGKKYYPKGIAQATEEDPWELPDDLIEAFKMIEDLVAEEKENKGTIELILINLERQYEKLLQYAIENNDRIGIQNTSEKVDHILTAKKRLRSNVNKRLLLENLALQLGQ